MTKEIAPNTNHKKSNELNLNEKIEQIAARANRGRFSFWSLNSANDRSFYIRLSLDELRQLTKEEPMPKQVYDFAKSNSFFGITSFYNNPPGMKGYIEFYILLESDFKYDLINGSAKIEPKLR